MGECPGTPGNCLGGSSKGISQVGKSWEISESNTGLQVSTCSGYYLRHRG